MRQQVKVTMALRAINQPIKRMGMQRPNVVTIHLMKNVVILSL